MVTLYTCSRYRGTQGAPFFERVNKRSTAKQHVGLNCVLTSARLRVRRYDQRQNTGPQCTPELICFSNHTAIFYIYTRPIARLL
jgi:hypothetical protein